jgi:uncharacterized membrane protein
LSGSVVKTKPSNTHNQRATLRFVRLHSRLLIAVIVGIAVAAIPFSLRTPSRILIGWDIGIALYLGLIHFTMSRCDIDRIKRRAAEQDEGAIAILFMSAAATLASLVAIVFELGAAKQGGSIASAVLAGATIVLSWSFVHTIFALHYAHEYYGERRDGVIGGLNFPEDTRPDYWDFLYFSVVIGMTSQVSDVAITSKSIRRLAAVHGVLSFFFNVSVLALTVNMVSNAI